MTTAGIGVPDIFEDAGVMYEAALERLAAGDMRDAAEKAWCATVRATEALVLARTGDEPHTSTSAGRRLRAAAQSDAALLPLRDSYLVRQTILHGECFYHDYCDAAETERLIRETRDYLAEARRLSA